MFTQGHTASYGIWLTQEPMFLTTRLFVTARPGSGLLLRVSGFATVEGPQVFIPAVSESSSPTCWDPNGHYPDCSLPRSQTGLSPCPGSYSMAHLKAWHPGGAHECLSSQTDLRTETHSQSCGRVSEGAASELESPSPAMSKLCDLGLFTDLLCASGSCL